MTYSIGFRAPSHAELLSDFVQEQMSRLGEDQRFSDPDFPPQQNSGEITDHTIDKISELLTGAAQDKQQLKAWFGEFITQPKYQDERTSPQPENIEETLKELKQEIIEGQLCLERNPASRFAFSKGSSVAQLFVDGLTFTTSNEFANELCGSRQFVCVSAADSELLCLAELIELGHIGWIED